MSALNLQSPLSFGKYRGLSIAAVIRFDPAYISWARANLPSVNFGGDVIDALRPALREEREESLNRQNAWAWGFGAGAKRAASNRRNRKIEIEHEERRKAGQDLCPSCFPHVRRSCVACHGIGWVPTPEASAERDGL